MKIIGIIGSSMGENSFGCGKHYLDFLSQFGKPRILLPTDGVIPLDLLVLPGGADLNPNAYSQIPGYYTGNTDVHKQHFYDVMLPQYVNNNTPILGICLGHQMLAAYFGSDLVQDLKYHAQSKARWETAHEIIPVSEEAHQLRLIGDKKPKKYEVNSHHHQAVLVSGLSDELTQLFVAPNEEDENSDPIVEVFRHNEKPIYGIQYHPEELRDIVSARIMYKLLGDE